MAIILTSWYYPSIKTIHLAIASLTLLFIFALGYCPLTKWEFLLRKKVEPDLDYDSSFLSYYAYKILGINLESKIDGFSA